MIVEVTRQFSKDLDKINSKPLNKKILHIISQVEQVKTISEIHNLKKLAGSENAYRIKTGDFRIGIFVSKNKVYFMRIANRKDIYKLFP